MIKYLRVRMPDGTQWDIPEIMILDRIPAGFLMKREFQDGDRDHRQRMFAQWAEDNLAWPDVEPYAVQVSPPRNRVDYEAGWRDGAKEIVER